MLCCIIQRSFIPFDSCWLLPSLWLTAVLRNCSIVQHNRLFLPIAPGPIRTEAPILLVWVVLFGENPRSLKDQAPSSDYQPRFFVFAFNFSPSLPYVQLSHKGEEQAKPRLETDISQCSGGWLQSYIKADSSLMINSSELPIQWSEASERYQIQALQASWNVSLCHWFKSWGPRLDNRLLVCAEVAQTHCWGFHFKFHATFRGVAVSGSWNAGVFGREALRLLIGAPLHEIHWGSVTYRASVEKAWPICPRWRPTNWYRLFETDLDEYLYFHISCMVQWPEKGVERLRLCCCKADWSGWKASLKEYHISRYGLIRSTAFFVFERRLEPPLSFKFSVFSACFPEI